jgi:hypothetical protein
MFILDVEQTDESPDLDQILREWWANLKARFAGETEPQVQNTEDERDRERSLIL